MNSDYRLLYTIVITLMIVNIYDNYLMNRFRLTMRVKKKLDLQKNLGETLM